MPCRRAKRLGARCRGVGTRTASKSACRRETPRADALVGCDGIHSVKSQHLVLRSEAFRQHPDVALADIGGTARRPQSGGARQLLVRPRPHADHLLGAAEKTLQHSGLGARRRGAARILGRQRRHFRDAALVRRRRAARPQDARAVPKPSSSPWHVLPRPIDKLDRGRITPARRRRASDGAVPRRRRRPEHRGCLDICARGGAAAGRCSRRLARIPSAAVPRTTRIQAGAALP